MRDETPQLQIPLWLARQTKISQGAKLAFGLISHFQEAYGRQDFLAENLGVGERQFRKYVAELVKFKLLRTEKRRDGVNFYYKPRYHPWLPRPKSTKEP